MATLYSKLKFFLEDNSLSWDNSKVKLENNGEGDFISMWEYSIAIPNDAKLNSYKTQADTLEKNFLSTKENAKTSAITKLKDLGLTDDEIKAIKEVV